MRVGKLILQMCAVVIAIAVCTGGYAFYRRDQVSEFQRKLTTIQSPVYSPFVDLILTAPPVICRYAASNFDEAARSVTYISDGRFRKTSGSLARPRETLHEIMDASGTHLWRDNSDTILFIPIEMTRQLPSDGVNAEQPGFGAILGGLECEVWWNPDDSFFRVPSDKPIIPYDEL